MDHPNQPPQAQRLSREAPPAERKYIEDVATALWASMPEGLSVSQSMGVVTLMLGQLFADCIKPEFRLQAFDECTAAMRKGVEDSLK